MACKPYENCFEFTEQNNKIVVCKDAKSSTKYIYQNDSQDILSKYKVDGCLIDDKDPKCDFLLINCTKGISYFVELKGSDLIKAVEQIDRTINVLHKDFNEYSVEPRIVLTRVNTTDLKSSKLIKLEKRLKKLKGKLIKESRQLIEKN
jgi:septum formation inhibitor-activating ATPase MinD